jgi:signal transduction histidine kinase
VETIADETIPESSRLNPKAELRLAALIALVSVIFLWPIQAFYIAEHALPALMLVYALHTLVTGTVLLASFRVVSARQADRLTILFTLGLTANLLLYLYLLPFAVPTYPSLISNALTCLLIADAVLFSWSTRRMLAISIATCLGFAAVGATLSLRGVPASPFALTLTWLGIGAALAVTCARVLGRFRASLMRRQTELAALSARLMSVQEEQLKSLSRELHDELGQSLTAVSSYMWLIEKQLPEELPALRTRTAEARRLVAKTLGQMRELSQLLRPPVLDLYGLGASLEAHLKAFGQRHQIATSFAADGVPDRLPAEIETAVYRITQEALTNVARHSKAARVRVSLTTEGSELTLEVEDDGVGLAADRDTRRGVGLIGIRERVLALGGAMTISSGPGLRLGVRVPLPAGSAN